MQVFRYSMCPNRQFVACAFARLVGVVTVRNRLMDADSGVVGCKPGPTPLIELRRLLGVRRGSVGRLALCDVPSAVQSMLDLELRLPRGVVGVFVALRTALLTEPKVC